MDIISNDINRNKDNEPESQKHSETVMRTGIIVNDIKPDESNCFEVDAEAETLIITGIIVNQADRQEDKCAESKTSAAEIAEVVIETSVMIREVKRTGVIVHD
ncbi:hypothetical protein [Stenomitos frigidus]|uniref:Uncharacterized protein n=1 Tax=Stenomitos frigidus ULC18 TaxID=2107698 RepID=A0A2T1EBG0_9CYAN|nr:hypothetical protein [Stenomitos frigidus]PSB30025.1 hypothetical protein C7B82_09640 [Stenomitos frigidus ULC18]